MNTKKNISNTKIFLLLLIVSMNYCLLYSCKNQTKYPKEQKEYSHKIVMGEPSKEGELINITKFDENGKKLEIQEDFNRNNEPNTITKFRRNSAGNCIEMATYKQKLLVYKEIFEFENDHKKSLKIYSGHNEDEKDLFLHAAVRYYYKSNKLIQKKQIGGINEFEEIEGLGTLGKKLSYISDDSTTIDFKYTATGKIDSVKINLYHKEYDNFNKNHQKLVKDNKTLPTFFKTVSTSFPLYKIYHHEYDNNDSLKRVTWGKLFKVVNNNEEKKIEYKFEKETVTIIKYLISGRIEEEISENGLAKTLTYYNEIGKKTKYEIFNKKDNQIFSKWIYSYNSKGNLIEKKNYNKLNELVEYSSYNYEY
jgi:hypothetical protein